MNLESIKSCVSALKEVRLRVHDQLEAGIRDEFDSVINRLELSLTEPNDQSVKVDLIEALSFLAKLIEVSTDLKDLISSIWK